MALNIGQIIVTYWAVETFVHLSNHHNHQLVGGKVKAIDKITVRKHLLVKVRKQSTLIIIMRTAVSI